MKYAIGDKVVPVSKSLGVYLDECECWREAKEGQGFLYVVDVDSVNKKYYLSHVKDYNSGNHYREHDLIPYEEQKQEMPKRKQDTYFLKLSECSYTTNVYQHGNIIRSFEEKQPLEIIQLIHNNNAMIVILEDGSKGVAKCMDGDEFDFEKGYEIAIRRAHIKQLQKELKKLVK